METYKYRKTMHLPFSEGLQNDDRRLENEHCFDGKTVAVTVKMDGENTSMYKHTIHARSLYAMSHYSQHWIKGFWGTVRYNIPLGWRVCGENLYARHSIEYKELPHYFQVFNIWNKDNRTLSYEDEIKFCRQFGFHMVELLAIVEVNDGDFSEIEYFYRKAVENGQEGIVIRNIESFSYEDFQENVAKAVRKNHVQTDEHWTKTWIPNKLKQ